MSIQSTPDIIIDFKLLVEELKECVWVFDLSLKKFIYISPSIYQLRGLTVAEGMAESLEDCFTMESLQKIKYESLRRYRRFMDGDRSDAAVYDLSEYEQYCKDGSTKIIEISTRLQLNVDTNRMLIYGVPGILQNERFMKRNLLIRSEISSNSLMTKNPRRRANPNSMSIFSENSEH